MLQRQMSVLMRASGTNQWDVVKYLVEKCKADANGINRVKQRTKSNGLMPPPPCHYCCVMIFATVP